MPAFIVFAVGGAVVAVAAWWMLRAYRRADAAPVSPRTPLIACAVAALAAVGLYIVVGSPDTPDAAYADRLAALKQRAPETYSADEAITVLRELAKERPNDPRPLVMIAELEAQSGRAELAASAFDEALRRDPRSTEAMVGLGVVLSARERGAITPYARELFTRARELEPQNPEPTFYLALAARQAGEADEARRLWREALTLLPADDPRRAMVQRMLEDS